MRRRPADVVAGLALAARAVGAREAVVFLKGSFDRPANALSSAIAAASLDGLSVEVRRGDDGYVTGEETALLEALEGRRPWPRPKPPLPAAVGFRGRPTLVQNVETLARVPAALADPEALSTGRDDARHGLGRRASAGRPRGAPRHAAAAGDRRARGGRDRAGRPRVPRRPRRGAPPRVRSRRAARPRGAPREGHGARHRGDPGRRRVGLPAGGGGLGGRLLRARELRPVPAVRGRHREPRPHPARGRVGRLAPARPARPRTTWPASCPATATARTAAPPPPSPPGWRAASRTRCEAHVGGGGCPWPERRHPDPFAPGSPERAAVEAAVQEQLR